MRLPPVVGARLIPDCPSCFALCCVLLPFGSDRGFGADKAGGEPCRHLDSDDGCVIHRDRERLGWPACVRFDCHGAGQQVSQATYAGRSWRAGTDRAEMAAVFSVMLELHGMLAILAENPGAAELARRISRASDADAATVLRAPVDDLWDEVDRHTGRRS